MELFDEMETKGIEPTQVTYSVTISALGNGLQWERALWLLNLMREKGIQVNLYTYNAGKKNKAKHEMRLMRFGWMNSFVSVRFAEHSLPLTVFYFFHFSEPILFAKINSHYRPGKIFQEQAKALVVFLHGRR